MRIVDKVADVQKRMVVEYGIELDGVWLPIAMLLVPVAAVNLWFGSHFGIETTQAQPMKIAEL